MNSQLMQVTNFYMDPEKTHIIYTAEDIQKYLAGRLQPAEMHAMEKAALEDAFLAEAMEGYEGMPENNWDCQLLALKNDFPKRKEAKLIAVKPSARYLFWKVAAAIFVLLGGIAITYNLTIKESSQDKSIAAINTKQDSIKSIEAEPGIADPDNKATTSLSSKANTRAIVQPPVARANQMPSTDSGFIYRPATVDKKAGEAVAGRGYVDDRVTNINDIATKNVVAPVEQNSRGQMKKSFNATTLPVTNAEAAKNNEPGVARRFTAQVTGPDGTPLPFANINITKENFGTYADAKGNFRLVSPDSILNIEIKSAGYISRNFTLKSSVPQNKIVLAEDELALKEKTQVTANFFKAGSKRRAALVPDSILNVEPEDGWSNYDTYITNNLALSDNILQKKIHGEVEVSFEVQSDGAITNVKIDKSLCNDCDEAALRVIKEGPRWKVKNGDKAIAKVKVKF